MAVLKRIVVQDFRNIKLSELEFSPNVNCISGRNGEGKTNLMDAIWYLSLTKSAFSVSDKFNFRHGTAAFALSGTYTMPTELDSVFSIKVSSDGSKTLKKDEKVYPRISEHIGTLPVVMVSPSDISLVSDSGEERRKFINSVLSQLDKGYLSDIQQYNRLLLQRNKLLKEKSVNTDLLAVFDERMTPLAKNIYDKRKQFIEGLLPLVQKGYKLLSSGREEVSISYQSDVCEKPLNEVFAMCREKDMALHFSTAGIQRDDLIFEMDGHPIRRCGSQGQQKSFLVALKFAQYEIMKGIYGYPPILLLDDVFDKLDIHRISNLLKLVAGNGFGQIFITDTNTERLMKIVDSITKDRAYFETDNGVFTKVEV